MKFLNNYLLVICFSFIYSFQGMFIDDNKNHLAFSGTYDSETDSEGKMTSLGGTTSYIIDGYYDQNPNGGTLELELIAQRGSFKHNTDSSLDFDLNVIGAAGYYYIKSRLSPVNFILGAGYKTLSADAKFLDEASAQMTGSLMSYGGGIYKTAVEGTVAKNFDYQIVPFIGFFINNTNWTVSISGMPDVENKDDSKQISAGLGIKFGPVTITPIITNIDGHNDFNVTVGFIL